MNISAGLSFWYLFIFKKIINEKGRKQKRCFSTGLHTCVSSDIHPEARTIQSIPVAIPVQSKPKTRVRFYSNPRILPPIFYRNFVWKIIKFNSIQSNSWNHQRLNRKRRGKCLCVWGVSVRQVSATPPTLPTANCFFFFCFFNFKFSVCLTIWISIESQRKIFEKVLLRGDWISTLGDDWLVDVSISSWNS